MNSAAIRAGKAVIEVLANDKSARGLNSAQGRMRRFAASAARLSAKFTAAGSAILAPLLLSLRTFSKTGDDIAKAAKRMNVGTEFLSEMDFAARRSGASLSDLETGFKGMRRTILDASRGLTSATDNLDELGVSVAELQSLSPEQQLLRLFDAVQKFDGDKTAIAERIFEESGSKLVPLINEGIAGIDKLRDRARDLGISLSPEDAAAAEALADAFEDVGTAATAMRMKIGAAISKPATGTANAFANASAEVVEFIDENRGLVTIAAAVGVGLVATGVAIAGVAGIALASSFIVSGLATAWAALGVVVGAVLSPIGLTAIAIGGLVAGIGYLISKSGSLNPLLRKLSLAGDDLSRAFGGASKALSDGKIELAAEIVFTGIRLAWLRMLGGMESDQERSMKGMGKGLQEYARLATGIFETISSAAESSWKGIGEYYDSVYDDWLESLLASGVSGNTYNDNVETIGPKGSRDPADTPSRRQLDSIIGSFVSAYDDEETRNAIQEQTTRLESLLNSLQTDTAGNSTDMSGAGFPSSRDLNAALAGIANPISVNGWDRNLLVSSPEDSNAALIAAMHGVQNSVDRGNEILSDLDLQTTYEQ